MQQFLREKLYAPPCACRRCGNRLLDVLEFARGREWEVSCFFCGDLWWTRRRVIEVVVLKYRKAAAA